MNTNTPQTDTPATPDAIWRATVIAAVNESLGTDLTEDSAAHTVSNTIITGISDLHKWQGQAADVARSVTAERDELAGKLATVTTERNNSRAFSDQLLGSAYSYHQLLANRLGVPYETAADAVSLCDALAPRLAVEAAAVDEVAAVSTFYLPDLIARDDDGHLPTPGKAILMLAQEVVKARAALTRANEDLNVAKAEAERLGFLLGHARADLQSTGRARDSWRDATSTTAKALAIAASALADVAAIR